MRSTSPLADARRHVIKGWVLIALTTAFTIYLLLHDGWPLAIVMAALIGNTIYWNGFLRGMIYLAEDEQ